MLWKIYIVTLLFKCVLFNIKLSSNVFVVHSMYYIRTRDKDYHQIWIYTRDYLTSTGAVMNRKGVHYTFWVLVLLNNFSSFQKWAAQKRSLAPTFWKPQHNGFLHSCAILIPQFVTVFPHFVAFFRTWTYFLLNFFPVLHLPIAQSHRVDPDVSVSFHAQSWKKNKLFIDE